MTERALYQLVSTVPNSFVLGRRRPSTSHPLGMIDGMNLLSIQDQHERLIQHHIHHAGFHIEGVLPSRGHPNYTYTIGFLLHGSPELVTIGLAPEDSAYLFHRIFEQLTTRTFTFGVDEEHEVSGAPLRFLPVPEEHSSSPHSLLCGIGSYLSRTNVRARAPIAVQLIWPDRNGRFPWQDGCDPTVVRDQPVLAHGDPPRRKQPARR